MFGAEALSLGSLKYKVVQAHIKEHVCIFENS
jgi:hypothetical protein